MQWLYHKVAAQTLFPSLIYDIQLRVRKNVQNKKHFSGTHTVLETELVLGKKKKNTHTHTYIYMTVTILKDLKI